jgi:hypothetical protein
MRGEGGIEPYRGVLKRGAMRPERTVLLPLVIALLLCSCAGSRESVKIEGQPLVPLDSADVALSVSAAYMRTDDLIALVGENSNPFLQWGNSPLIVFRLSVKGASRDISLLYRSFELHHAGGVKSPLPHFYITQYWDNKLGRYSSNKSIEDWVSNRKKYARWTSGKVTYNVRRYMIPQKKRIKRGEDYEGLVVFEGSAPKSGRLILTVHVYSETGEELAALDFEYKPST